MSELGIKDVKASEVGSMAVIEYLLPKVQGVPLQQKNFIGCAAKDDIYIDLHLSKVLFKPADESLFNDILNHVHIGDRATQSSDSDATSFDYFREGSQFYAANDFRNAIGPYQKALDLEKQQPELSKNYWHVLVDNLGMAYGITNDLKRAEETFNYGVSKDPDYPMFYYNLGCVYAERNDMDKSMDYLRKAFALKANSIPGESMPDPRHDDSFQRFMSNERFRKFADSLVTTPN
jgi:tetratricopeptide (TPR) repeat protein